MVGAQNLLAAGPPGNGRGRASSRSGPGSAGKGVHRQGREHYRQSARIVKRQSGPAPGRTSRAAPASASAQVAQTLRPHGVMLGLRAPASRIWPQLRITQTLGPGMCGCAVSSTGQGFSKVRKAARAGADCTSPPAPFQSGYTLPTSRGVSRLARCRGRRGLKPPASQTKSTQVDYAAGYVVALPQWLSGLNSAAMQHEAGL